MDETLHLISFLKIFMGWAPSGAMWTLGWLVFCTEHSIVSSKISHQDLSNEGSKKFELGFQLLKHRHFLTNYQKLQILTWLLTIFSRNVRYQNVLNFDREAFSYKFTNHTWFGGEIWGFFSLSHREVGNLSGTSISIEVLGYMALPKGLLCRKTLSTVTDILFNMSGPFDP